MPIVDLKTLEQDLVVIIAQILEIEPDKVRLDADFVNDLGMDSMMALEILAKIEKKFGIQIPEEKLGELHNLRDAIKLTNTYLK